MVRKRKPDDAARALIRAEVREAQVEEIIESDQVAVVVEAPLSESIIESSRQYTDAARAQGTRTVYEKRYGLFERWCRDNGRKSIPTSVDTLTGYFTYMADDGRLDRRNVDRSPGLSVSSIQLAYAAIVRAHQLKMTPKAFTAWNAHRDPRVVELLRGIRRRKGVAPKGKKPILVDVLKQIIRATPDKTIIGMRDRAIIALGFNGAFRRSELVALDIEDIADEPSRGIRVRIRRSKTDQEGVGRTIGIPYSKDKTMCPVLLLRAWIDGAGARADMSSGPIFRRVYRSSRIGARLTSQQVLRTVKNALARIGTTGNALDEYGAHSLRAGLATSAYLAGKRTNQIKEQGRWKSTQTLDRYIRDLDLFDENAADGLT